MAINTFKRCAILSATLANRKPWHPRKEMLTLKKLKRALAIHENLTSIKVYSST